MIHFWPVPVLSDNYVWILQPEGSAEVVVVDPGDGPLVRDTLASRGLRPAAILLTHHHADHTAGVASLLDMAPAPVYGPAVETIATVDRPIGGGDTIEVEGLGLELQVMDVPGHTAGHVAYAGDGFVLCGDTLFAGGCGRVFEGTPQQMVESLTRLAALDPSTALYCAHEYTVANLRFATQVEPGNSALADRLAGVLQQREMGEPTVPSTIETELRTNPFLRCRKQSVIEAAEAYSGGSLSNEVEVFAVVRAWKDRWRG